MKDTNQVTQLINNSNITAYLNMIKLHDEDTYKHCIAVGTLTYLFLQELQKQETKPFHVKDINEIIKGALILDIGKIYLPFGLMRSTKELDKYEQMVLQEHPLIGYVSIKDSDLSDIIKTIVLKHHCTLNDSGYPVGEKILDNEEYVWVVAICDKINAMTSYRPFKESLSYEEAFSEIVKMSKEEVIPYKYMSVLKEVIKREAI